MKPTRPEIDPRLDTLLRHVLAIGAALVLLLPAARGFSQTLGWMPLWLLVMPACAWWALHRFRLPRGEAEEPVRVQRQRRRAALQARRRPPSLLRRRHSQAA